MTYSCRFWQAKNQERNNSDLFASGHRPAPFSKRTYPEIAIVFSPDQMPAEIE